MRKWAILAGAACVVGGACVVREELPRYASCGEGQRECHVAYSRLSGYYRVCSTVAVPCQEQGVGSNRPQAETESPDPGLNGPASERDAGAKPTAEAPPSNLGAAPLPDRTRYSAFDFPCERDSQCGPGQCLEGDCYYGCSSDAECGSGDRCAAESGTRICLPDPNPPVQCTRSAQCADGYACLNASCRQTCTATEQCDNLLDRCTGGLCVPDRRPLGECVLNSECAEGAVCLDGACVAACPADAPGDSCLSDPGSAERNDAGVTPSSPGAGAAPDPDEGAEPSGGDFAADSGAEPVTIE